MTRRGRESSRAWIAWVAVALVVCAVALVPLLRTLARKADESARATWSATVAVETLAASRPVRVATASAAQLEETAASVGIALLPRQSPRRATGTAPHVVATGAALTTLHSDLVSLLSDPRATLAPDLASWLEARGPTLDALAVDVLTGEPPRWEDATGRILVRSPSPIQRIDGLVVESGRLAEIPDGAPISDADEHLTRPGTPRLEGIVQLEEALLLRALARGLAGDGASALRALQATARLEEGVADDADVVTLGVLSNLARMRLAVVRRLDIAVEPRPLLGPSYEQRLSAAILREASEWARSLDEVPRKRKLPGHIVGLVLDPESRAARARTLENLHRIATALRGPRLSDGDLASLATEVDDAAPFWDGPQDDYLGGLVAIWTRLRRADLDAELTRRLLEARIFVLATGNTDAACEQASAGTGDRSPAAFRCETRPEGASIAAAAPPLVIGPPAPFDPPPHATVIAWR